MNIPLDEVQKMVRERGRVWLGGEMEFDVCKGGPEAYRQAAKIAEACGYSVERLGKGWRIKVSGHEIAGYYVFEWFKGRAEIVKIQHWTCDGTIHGSIRNIVLSALIISSYAA